MSRQHEQILVGIDGGGSRGRLMAALPDGRVLGLVETGPLNINNVPEDEIVASLLEGLAALRGQKWPGSAACSVSAGVAGLKDAEDAVRFDAILSRVFGESLASGESVNDIVILQAAGLAGQPGIALILGTGSHAYGQNAAGASATCGGWGCLMDDCGGGYAIGHAAMRAAVRMWDGRLPSTALAGLVMDHLGITSPGASLRRVHNTDFGFDDVKALAPKVTALAASGDATALAILTESAGEGAELVDTLCRKLDLGASPDVVITGGVAMDSTFQPLLLAALRRTLPGVRLVVPDLPPVAGAVIRAATLAGIRADEPFLRNLRDTQRNPHPLP